MKPDTQDHVDVDKPSGMLIRIATKLARADPDRKTRLHDRKGHFVGRGIVDLPYASVTWILARLFSYRARRPWIPLPATRAIGRVLTRDSRVLEFGSGMSTPWLGRRCRLLVSIESVEAWAERVRPMLSGYSNVEYHVNQDEGAPAMSYPDGFFDLAIVDGFQRSAGMRAALLKVRSGGYIYLDNSDNSVSSDDTRDAEDELLRSAAGTPKYIVGFAPASLTPSEGLLVRLSGPSDTGSARPGRE